MIPSCRAHGRDATVRLSSAAMDDQVRRTLEHMDAAEPEARIEMLEELERDLRARLDADDDGE